MRDVQQALDGGAGMVLHDSARDEVELEEERSPFVEEIPCARCSRKVPVTQALLDMAADANHARAAMGWALARKSELVLCWDPGNAGNPGCYARWRDELERESHRRWSEDRQAWKAYLANADADPALLRNKLNERGRYEDGIRAVERRRRIAREKREAKRAKAETQKHDADVFGEQPPPQQEMRV